MCVGVTFVGSHHVISSIDESQSGTLDGFRITCGANSTDGGAGIYIVDSGPIVVDCTFEDNGTELGDGGAARVDHGSPGFFNCSFISNSNYFGEGAGIYSVMSTVTFVKCDFTENFCENAMINDENTNAVLIGCIFDSNSTGGCTGSAGIANNASTVLISGCYFVNNDDEGTGAIGNTGSTVAIDNCVFENNNGDASGAISNTTSTVSILHCTFVSNSGGDGAATFGGAVRNDGSTVHIADCAFFGNSAGSLLGGAINNIGTDAVIVNCVFSRNFAGSGGAVSNINSDPVLYNCSFSANQETQGTDNGEAIYADATSAPTLINCIVWNHDEPTFGGAGQMTFAYCDIEDGVPPGVGNISADPLFVDADGADNIPGTIDDNLRLLPGSPCIDAGDNAAVPLDEFDLDNDGDTAEPIPFDLAGLPRFVDDPKTIDTGNGSPPIVDMGAYEFTGMINPLDLTGDGVVDAADLAQLLADWGTCPGCPADYTADGIVNAADLGELLANWG